MKSRPPKQISPFIRRLAFHGALGAILGVLLLHPLITAVFFLEFKSQFDIPSESIWDFAITRLQTNAWFELVPMNAIFALIGASFSIVISAYSRTLDAQQRRVSWLEKELDMNLLYLVDAGESECLELWQRNTYARLFGRKLKSHPN